MAFTLQKALRNETLVRAGSRLPSQLGAPAAMLDSMLDFLIINGPFYRSIAISYPGPHMYQSSVAEAGMLATELTCEKASWAQHATTTKILQDNLSCELLRVIHLEIF